MTDISDQQQEEDSQSNLRVLIVDDSSAQRKVYELLAEQLGIKAQVVDCCREAMQVLQAAEVDAILMDWEMPEIDGLICAQMIRTFEQQQNRRTPIIAVTWHNAEGDREKCLQSGLDDHLPKPFTFEQLDEKLRYWLQRK
jgi:CheY-like chemotaxis protein